MGTTDGQVVHHFLGIHFGTHTIIYRPFMAPPETESDKITSEHWLYVTQKTARITSFKIYIDDRLYILMEHDGTSTFIGERFAQVFMDRI